MRIRILKTFVSGRFSGHAREVVEVPAGRAGRMIQAGIAKAEPEEEKKEPTVEAEPEEEKEEPAVEAEPKGKTKKTAKKEGGKKAVEK